MTTLTDDATEQLDVAANKLPSYSLPASSNWVRFFVTDFWGRNYFNFKGRASRKEYWAGLVLGYVYSIVIFLLIYFGGKIVFGLSSHNAQDITTLTHINDIVSFFLVSVPSISLLVRRLHDFNLRGWWLLLFIPSLFAPFFKGDRADNRFDTNIYSEYEDPNVEKISYSNRSFGQIACSIFTENFCTLKGRASRKEFNTFWGLLVVLPCLVAYILPTTTTFWVAAFLLIFIYPVFSVAWRRLHDLNLSGWWLLLGITIIILPFIRGKKDDNAYGQNIYVE